MTVSVPARMLCGGINRSLVFFFFQNPCQSLLETLRPSSISKISLKARGWAPATHNPAGHRGPLDNELHYRAPAIRRELTIGIR